MTTKSAVIIALAIVAGFALCGLILKGQERYQLTGVATANAHWVYLTDTQTGRVWYQVSGQWDEHSPDVSKPRQQP
jgi:hypothetical protein